MYAAHTQIKSQHLLRLNLASTNNAQQLSSNHHYHWQQPGPPHHHCRQPLPPPTTFTVTTHHHPQQTQQTPTTMKTRWQWHITTSSSANDGACRQWCGNVPCCSDGDDACHCHHLQYAGQLSHPVPLLSFTPNAGAMSPTVRSLPSPGYSIWNPWNECWLRAQPISYSMDIMDSMWSGHGMINSTWIPHGFHMDSTGFHMECRHIHLGFHGNSSRISEKQPYLINKNISNTKNQTPASGTYHMMYGWALLPLHYVTIKSYEYKLHKSC